MCIVIERLSIENINKMRINSDGYTHSKSLTFILWRKSEFIVSHRFFVVAINFSDKVLFELHRRYHAAADDIATARGDASNVHGRCWCLHLMFRDMFCS